MPFPAAPFLSAVSFSSALFLSLLALPRLGVFVAMFAGVPIIMAQLRYPAVLLGTGAMVTSGGVIFLFASLIDRLPGTSSSPGGTSYISKIDPDIKHTDNREE